ncbi:MAG: hypothetical protein ACP5G0_11995 [Desulfomonilia bacterium]
MADYKIRCEVIGIHGDLAVCPGSSKIRMGEVHLLDGKTPAGMCARAYTSLYPVALAMRFSDEIPWEDGKKHFDITCPDTFVVYRLSREKI